jgi:hypothetical protein
VTAKAGEVSHAYLHMTVEGILSAQGKDALVEVPVSLMEQVKYLLQLTSPLTFT